MPVDFHDPKIQAGAAGVTLVVILALRRKKATTATPTPASSMVPASSLGSDSNSSPLVTSLQDLTAATNNLNSAANRTLLPATGSTTPVPITNPDNGTVAQQPSQLVALQNAQQNASNARTFAAVPNAATAQLGSSDWASIVAASQAKYH